VHQVIRAILADPGEPPYPSGAWWRFWWRGFWLALLALVIFVATLYFVAPAHARDDGQWDDSTDPAIRAWYRGLMQPDVPTASCCGEADAYWCDDYRAGRDGKAYCTISDDRPDEPRGRPHIDVGTEIQIPTNKLKFDRGNPTGHGVVFLSRQGYPFCYVQPGGV
jgi:hypothetical protein